jgi:hypothetical protein
MEMIWTKHEEFVRVGGKCIQNFDGDIWRKNVTLELRMGRYY